MCHMAREMDWGGRSLGSVGWEFMGAVRLHEERRGEGGVGGSQDVM